MNINKSPLVSIIILNYNGKQHLDTCITSVERLTYHDYELILVDNGSSDGSADFVRSKFPLVRLLVLDKNYGFAEGNNRGVEIAKGKYIAFLNNDTEVDKNWLGELVKYIDKEGNNVVACSSKMLFYNDRDIINYAGAKFTIIGMGYEVGHGKHDDPSFNRTEFTGAPCGGAFLINKQIFLASGGFDNSYFAYHEDSDLGWRLWLSGYKVLYVPSSIVFHKHMASWKKYPEQRAYYGTRNRLFNIVTHLQMHNLLIGLCTHNIYITYLMLIFLKDGNFRAMRGVLYGILGFTKMLPKVIKKRRQIQKDRKLSDSTLTAKCLMLQLGQSLRLFWQNRKV